MSAAALPIRLLLIEKSHCRHSYIRTFVPLADIQAAAVVRSRTIRTDINHVKLTFKLKKKIRGKNSSCRWKGKKKKPESVRDEYCNIVSLSKKGNLSILYMEHAQRHVLFAPYNIILLNLNYIVLGEKRFNNAARINSIYLYNNII